MAETLHITMDDLIAAQAQQMALGSMMAGAGGVIGGEGGGDFGGVVSQTRLNQLLRLYGPQAGGEGYNPRAPELRKNPKTGAIEKKVPGNEVQPDTWVDAGFTVIPDDAMPKWQQFLKDMGKKMSKRDWGDYKHSKEVADYIRAHGGPEAFGIDPSKSWHPSYQKMTGMTYDQFAANPNNVLTYKESDDGFFADLVDGVLAVTKPLAKTAGIGLGVTGALSGLGFVPGVNELAAGGAGTLGAGVGSAGASIGTAAGSAAGSAAGAAGGATGALGAAPEVEALFSGLDEAALAGADLAEAGAIGAGLDIGGNAVGALDTAATAASGGGGTAPEVDALFSGLDEATLSGVDLAEAGAIGAGMDIGGNVTGALDTVADAVGAADTAANATGVAPEVDALFSGLDDAALSGVDLAEAGAIGAGLVGGGDILDAIGKYGGKAIDAAKKLVGGDSDALDDLLKLGVPAALLAGLFEKNDSPLLEPMTDAAKKAIEQANKFAGMEPTGLSEGQQMAIDLAKANAGKGQAMLDKSGALADQAAAGIDPERIQALMNPELQAVLDTTIRDIENAAARRREQLAARVARSGNDYRTPVETGNRFNIEDSLLDEAMFQEIGDTTGALRANAWNNAAALARGDLDRVLQAGALYSNNAKASGALTGADFANLSAAGALEKEPENQQRQHVADATKLYTGVVHGTAPAIDATEKPSKLSQAAGALGALKSAKDIGLY